jgi:hypothetical protein
MSVEHTNPQTPTRRRVLVRAGALGVVALTLPSAGASASTSETSGGYSTDGSADPSLAAVSAIPSVNADGSVTVTGNDEAA